MLGFSTLLSNDLGVDLGTANTLIFARGRGIVVNEPSIVAINKHTHKVEAVGTEAKKMLGRAPGHIAVVEPLQGGVIADLEATEKMLQHFILKAQGGKPVLNPRIIIGVPGETTTVERRAVEDVAYSARASKVFLVREVMAAALGAGLPVDDPCANLVVDIGGGTTDIAVISMSGIVYSQEVRVAGHKMDEAIIHYLKHQYNLLIGPRTAEQVKIDLGSAYPFEARREAEIKGRGLDDGMPRTVTVNDEEVREALSGTIKVIVNAVRSALEVIPPELAGDIVDRGIVLTGGGSLLNNLDKRLSLETGLPVSIDDDPLKSVALGTGLMLEDLKRLNRLTWEQTTWH